MPVEYMELSSESKESQALHAESLRKLEAIQRARAIVVPTDQLQIKERLRELGHPITLFGEGPADRRERLRNVIAALELSDEELARVQEIMNQSSRGDVRTEQHSSAHQKETVYSPATEEMIAIRRALAEYSFSAARSRIIDTHRIRVSEKEQAEEDRRALALQHHSKELVLNASQFADERPINCVRFSPSGSSIVSSSFGCAVKIWDSATLSMTSDLRGHEERVTSAAWFPTGDHMLASSSADGTAILWDISKEDESVKAVSQMKGHQGAVLYCDFHPSGRLLATCGSDTTWRLWDVENSKEILLQDGHYKECSAISFQKDGGLALSTDWAGVALLWDLRSGQMIQAFQGHIKKISCAAFHPNSYQVATGSTDNMVRVWDLRKRKCGYCLPAHANVISEIRYSQSGELLVSSSFDGTIKVWGSRDFKPLRALSGHSGRVMSVDISVDERHLISAGFDRTIKTWAHQSEF